MNDKPTFDENSIVEALLGAAEFRLNSEERAVVIKRGDKEFFRFNIRGVNEDQVKRAQKLSTLNRGRRDEQTDWGRYSAHLIYFATVDDDKKRLWDNRSAWQALNAVNGADVVFKCLMPAERAKIVEVIEKLSGYDDSDIDIDAHLKN